MIKVSYDTFLENTQRTQEARSDRWEAFCDSMLCADCVHHASALDGNGYTAHICCVDEPFRLEHDTCPENCAGPIATYNPDDYYYAEHVREPRTIPGFGEYNLMDELERLNFR